jgi:hypothetical protein|tara:strand:+ start:388 stop:588 length:201 start_codon:yes stop_codon:yes gene_type:complete
MSKRTKHLIVKIYETKDGDGSSTLEIHWIRTKSVVRRLGILEWAKSICIESLRIETAMNLYNSEEV